MLPRLMKFDCLPKDRDEQTHHLKSLHQLFKLLSVPKTQSLFCNHLLGGYTFDGGDPSTVTLTVYQACSADYI